MNLDQSTKVRQDEALDTIALQEYLRDIVPQVREKLEIEQFPGGYSNLTYLLRAGDRELVLRRPPHGANIASAHDMSREYRVISGLHKPFPRAPAPIHYCADESIIGAPFYLMQRIQGIILRSGISTDLAPDKRTMRELSESFVSCLVELHSIDPLAANLADLGKAEGYVQRQVSGWIGRYEKSATDVIADMDLAANWLSDNLPPDTPATLIHNDYKYDNLVLSADDPTKIIGVLDWEMATIGDPLMDLGMSLAYWSQANDRKGLQQFNLTYLPGNYSRSELLEAYARLSGRSVDNALFYYRFGLYKLAVILQQIYARYHAGLTQDPRFAGLIAVVGLCAQQARCEEI